MKTKKRFLLPIICVLAIAMMFALSAVAFVGCGGGSIESIEISQETVNMYTGDTVSLTVKAIYSNGDEKRLSAKDGLTWTSSNEAIAKVSNAGTVTAQAKGDATITATVDKMTATCKVSVNEMTVELDKTEITVNSTTPEQLTATAKVNGVVDETVEFEWSSSDEEVATVDANGLVTAWDNGKATITAKRKGGNQSATCEVTGVWEEPVGYNPVQWAEQNKIRPNTWGYWNAKESSWAGGALATDHRVYTDETFVESASTLNEGFEYIGMGRATFEFTITNPGVNYVYQIFYRSSDNFTDDEGNKGELKFNHNYEMTMKIVSSVGGEVHINPYDDVRAREIDAEQEENSESVEDYNAYLLEQETAGKIMLVREEGELVTDRDGVYVTNHDFTLEENVEQEIHLIFKHDDCGYIYKDGIYDNMGSALHIQCGDLEDNKRVTLSVWDVQYKDLGACDNPYEEDITKHAGYVDPNATNVPDDLDIPETWNTVKGGVTATKASIVAEDNKAIFKMEGTLNLSEFNSSEDEAEEYLKAYFFDAQEGGGNWLRYYFNVVDVDVTEEGNFTIKYDITYLGIFESGRNCFTCHFGATSQTDFVDLKLGTDAAVHGEGVTVGNKKYTISNVESDGNVTTNWGCVSIKVEVVE